MSAPGRDPWCDRIGRGDFYAARAVDTGPGDASGRAMPSETVHIVQTYVAGRGQGLKAEPPVGCKTAEDARRKAERLAPNREGVIAYTVSADVEMGDYDETPTVLFKAGRLPPPWDEA